MPLIVEGQTIPYGQMRYPTLADWVGHKRLRFFQIAEIGNPSYEALLFLHEFCEFAYCLEHGISEESVTNWDVEYEKNRKLGDDSEPGDDPKSPYYEAHQHATMVEKLSCEAWGLDWNAYGRFLNEYITKNLSGGRE